MARFERNLGEIRNTANKLVELIRESWEMMDFFVRDDLHMAVTLYAITSYAPLGRHIVKVYSNDPKYKRLTEVIEFSLSSFHKV